MQEINQKSYSNNQDSSTKTKQLNKFTHQQVNQHIVSALQNPRLGNSTHRYLNLTN